MDFFDVVKKEFCKDSLISIATIDLNNGLSVRTVDSVYIDDGFYVITYLKSNKMKQILSDSRVAICGEWFQAHGIGYNLGYIKSEENATKLNILKEAFKLWYSCGHIKEDDPNTVLLKIEITDGIIFRNDQKYQYKKQ